MSQKYFNAIKTKVHFLGVASIDREIVKEKTGKKNVVTKKDIEKGVVKSETRKITFRDDNFVIDSKSRFADIVESIPLDSDELIKAVTDAIKSELAKSGKSFDEAKKEQEKLEEEKFKKLEQAEAKAKAEKELNEVLDCIKIVVNNNKSNVDFLSTMMAKSKELGYENPMVIDNIDDANTLLEFIKSDK